MEPRGGPATRDRAGDRRGAGAPASALAPFGAANALDLSDVRACAHWPYTTPVPPARRGPLPNVPTLILSGETDLRTPTANAREVAAQIPDAQLLLVPGAGHSVLDERAGDVRETGAAGDVRGPAGAAMQVAGPAARAAPCAAAAAATVARRARAAAIAA